MVHGKAIDVKLREIEMVGTRVIEFHDLHEIGVKLYPVAVCGAQTAVKACKSIGRNNGQRLFLSSVFWIFGGEKKGNELPRVVRVEVAEKDKRNGIYGGVGFQQSVDGASTAIKE
jgi:hypothetical protein